MGLVKNMAKPKWKAGDQLVIRPWMPIKSERIKIVAIRDDWYLVETDWAGPASRRLVYHADLEREAELERNGS